MLKKKRGVRISTYLLLIFPPMWFVLNSFLATRAVRNTECSTKCSSKLPPNPKAIPNPNPNSYSKRGLIFLRGSCPESITGSLEFQEVNLSESKLIETPNSS